MKTQDNIDQVSDSNESNTEKNNTNENRGDLQGTHSGKNVSAVDMLVNNSEHSAESCKNLNMF